MPYSFYGPMPIPEVAFFVTFSIWPLQPSLCVCKVGCHQRTSSAHNLMDSLEDS